MSAYRKVYGKGYYDGFKAAKAQQDMTPSKYKKTLDSQTAIARKIFECTPIAEAWSSNKIVSEMTRVYGTRTDLRTVEGCLDSLKNDGLVKEPERGAFQRVAPRVPETAPAVEKAQPAAEPAAKPAMIVLGDPTGELAEFAAAHAPVPFVDFDPIVMMGEFATTLRGRAETLTRVAEILNSTADMMELSAVGVMERLEQAEKGVEKFRQLTALLKEI